MGNNITGNIFKTLIYADIFDYPLTKEEVWRFFICGKPVSKKQIEKMLVSFDSKHGYFYLKKRDHIVGMRKIREKESQKKLQIAKRIASILRIIPSVCLIGVSGNLSMNNAGEKDDIDIFVISKSGTLWSTRLLLILLLKIMGKHRGKLDRHVENKICINMFVDERDIAIPLDRRNLYTAHEVIQMKPIFVKGDVYKRFIVANSWVRKFLPNSIDQIMPSSRAQAEGNYELKINGGYKKSIIEFLAKKVQFWYMKKYITSEVVSDTILAFHPGDYTNIILKKYHEMVKQYEKI